MTFSFETVGRISSPYKEKFAIPRQPSLAPSVRSQVVLDKRFSLNSVQGLHEFSHIWLSFIFHQHLDTPMKEMIRPPRLGGNKKVGVFASRSTFRPNPLGLSVVELLDIKQAKGQVIIDVAGADLLDGTPIVDIKPYIAYVDAVKEADSGFASEAPKSVEVSFSEEVAQTLKKAKDGAYISTVIREVLSQDPRPAYQREEGREYGVKLFDYNVQWVVSNSGFLVTSVC
ncbi:tRNA (N6-threonylcarbamoyladenosine(37)-N6)-methyltransferase TrmO [Salinibius halmophilus]|uniref:tRNA (N6-threonylcarbamoyladenosine(37)-N6)-methyltransferase TrmO n=1 Tax=Salinibius halmophilus TaxID=1853216 RepID=UPI000E66D86F|nr:tRNA (N6-threonylcarbamoyladenosine(37)-N6)-methyltransferase TrmO [Salinibius halmophilus]